MAEELTLKKAIRLVGGPGVVGEKLQITPRAVSKWIFKGALPRTEFSGETECAERIAAMDGSTFTAEELMLYRPPSFSKAASTLKPSSRSASPMG